MPQEEHGAPKEHLTLYRDGSLGRTPIEAVDELIIAGRFPIIPAREVEKAKRMGSSVSVSELQLCERKRKEFKEYWNSQGGGLEDASRVSFYFSPE
ncbi:hypothetical protein B0T20DRAFT_505602 [Sordaria brevicollis]|uniref:Uncharacterized protein n=1 Tax=Sordaria brevicollis TaxID=83679 RepID=A0AAE0PH23_SORBR|nr:hypothetical protein B0T20DRAFT_505602 [Sordaria brevicollis]